MHTNSKTGFYKYMQKNKNTDIEFDDIRLFTNLLYLPEPGRHRTDGSGAMLNCLFLIGGA